MSKAGKTVIQHPESAASGIWLPQCHTGHADGLNRGTSQSLAFIMSDQVATAVMT